ncbi:PRC-barrel domain-containing protein [Cesiribacter sp. SM1]|uniref:PRC-barrel domain-containing protein n=1 Tax=Cesiribacter sp. SM1 TaxID=2861196 RepID=UPI001CD7B971|nr:PRC-barrel domain-containing protein [Cesiribacter sp. SM1]
MNYQNYTYISDIIGKPVQNSLAQEYGNVSDVILSASHRRVVAVVVEKGGFLGMGADHFILPWQMLQVNPNTFKVLVEADRKTIEDAPLVDIDKVREGDFDTLSLIFSYYGVDEFWKSPSEDPETYEQNYRAGEDLGERLPSNEGSHQITKHYPGQRNSHIREELNYDKIKGISKSDEK